MAIRGELIKTSLRGTVTETAANTFTEAQIDTNLSIRGDHVFIVTGVWLYASATLGGAGDTFSIQVCYASQAGNITPDDPDWLFGASWQMAMVTSGAGVWLRTMYTPVEHFPIAVPQLYLGVGGSSLATAAKGSIKIEGYHSKVNTTEFFRLAQSR